MHGCERSTSCHHLKGANLSRKRWKEAHGPFVSLFVSAYVTDYGWRRG
jgi:hypothetical protein